MVEVVAVVDTDVVGGRSGGSGSWRLRSIGTSEEGVMEKSTSKGRGSAGIEEEKTESGSRP